MKRTINTLILALIIVPLFAQSDYQSTAENGKNREWFQDAKYGLFIHWGVYSEMAGGAGNGIAEWIMNKKNIGIAQNEKLPGFFNSIDFDPVEWVSMVKKAGMNYITITWFDSGEKVVYKKGKDGIVLTVPKDKRKGMSTITVIRTN